MSLDLWWATQEVKAKKKKSIEGYGYGISWSHIKTEMMMAVKWWWWHYTASAVVTEHGR